MSALSDRDLAILRQLVSGSVMHSVPRALIDGKLVRFEMLTLKTPPDFVQMVPIATTAGRIAAAQPDISVSDDPSA